MGAHEKLTTREFWEKGYADITFSKHEGHGIDSFIRKYIPANANGTCLEIGSYPGPFLASFGDLGYKLNGIDFHPGNEKALPEWLRSMNYKTGKFESRDFFDFYPSDKFDVVASFGFIEHFGNFSDVISRHAELVNVNGYIIITTPNFRGWIQQVLHRAFDKTNLSYHNLNSMHPERWAARLETLGFEIHFKGYFGDFWFWRSPEKMGFIRTKLCWLAERLIPRIRKILWFQSPAFSAYCGIVARKTG